MLTLVALFLAAAPEPAAPEPLKLATGNFTFVGISQDLRGFVPEEVANRLRRAGVQIITQNEIQSLLGLERQKQLTGCADDGSNCMAELAGALGVEGVLLGELAKVGDTIALNLKIVHASNGKSLATYTTRVDGENHLLDAIDQGADALAEEALFATGRRRLPTAGAGSAAAWIIPAASGAAVAIGGGVLLGLAGSNHDQLRSTATGAMAITDVAGRKLASDGNTFQTAGFIAIGVGAAAVVTGAILFITGRRAPVQASVSVGPGSGAVVFGGALP
jgi:hypothetical protein